MSKEQILTEKLKACEFFAERERLENVKLTASLLTAKVINEHRKTKITELENALFKAEHLNGIYKKIISKLEK